MFTRHRLGTILNKLPKLKAATVPTYEPDNESVANRDPYYCLN